MDKLLQDYKAVTDKRILERRPMNADAFNDYLESLPDVADNAGEMVIEPVVKIISVNNK
ncbi:MAG: hypothetical protein U1C55_04650 [Smithellaceae bacterium]|nr:hypothetical protein [Smithellaceae bacterium]